MEIKELTKAEEEIMQILWELDGGFVKDIIAEISEPKPAYNTVSTIVRILVQKEMVDHTSHGKSHRYHPLITKEEYSKYKMDNLMSGYFEGSFSNMVSFFVKKKQLNTKELDDILKIIENNKES
ncbi:putative transcriptional regulator [Owenweeksia hongkongensis DSM 17368]|uniref:Putative transcriptional regulator n=1 Tax=Owenweeksia hongkongensis (strain DSM 17368 / CIP 108786 / JCM 12287 / NRRL B-23963 / UST20020801) TaxID=926562 RepID=G8R889_OWEHD|nr:putative transcriptional regulator [Owenweeksia hongkongensis DSM 17368]